MAVASDTVPEAHTALLKARYFYNQFTDKSLDLAGQYYRESLRHDPDYAPAYAGLSDLAWAPSVIGWQAFVSAAAGRREDAQAMLQRAVAGKDEKYVVPMAVAWAYTALGD